MNLTSLQSHELLCANNPGCEIVLTNLNQHKMSMVEVEQINFQIEILQAHSVTASVSYTAHICLCASAT